MLGILYMCCFEYDVIQKMISRFWKNIFSILISLLECRKKKKNLQHIKPVNLNFLYHHLPSSKEIFLRSHLYKYSFSMMIISNLTITHKYLYMWSFVQLYNTKYNFIGNLRTDGLNKSNLFESFISGLRTLRIINCICLLIRIC